MEEKTGKTDWAVSHQLLSDLGKLRKIFYSGVQDLTQGGSGSCVRTGVHVRSRGHSREVRAGRGRSDHREESPRKLDLQG